MSIYFALEYDANGVSRIVQKKDTSTRAITQRDFNLGTYVGNQITSPEDPNQPDEGNTTGDFISQMGTGTIGGDDMTDFERFIDRGNLQAFMDKGGNDTKFVNAIFAAMGVPVTAEGLTKFFDSIAKMLPAESEEIKRIRKFYATEGKIIWIHLNLTIYQVWKIIILYMVILLIQTQDYKVHLKIEWIQLQIL